jgi:1-hydroxycarotenoid 3,4-desaturase
MSNVIQLPEQADVVVIGGGVGGLSTAICLQAAGRSVLLLERHPRCGGKLGTVVVDGVEFDTGPSLLTMPDIFADILGRAGLAFGKDLELLQPSPAFRYHFPSRAILDVFVDPADTLRSIEATFGTAAAREMAGFWRYAQGIWDASKDDFIFHAAPTAMSLVRLGLSRPGALLKVDPFSSMRGAIEARVNHPDLRSLLMRYATYNGSDPLTAPATLNCIIHVEQALGAFGVKGGMGALRDALVRGAEQLGVSILNNVDVTSLVDDGARVTGVRVGDQVVRAAAVVVNADVAHLRDHLLSAPLSKRAALPSATKVTPSMSGATMVLKARRRRGKDARVAHEVFFCADYPAEFNDIFRRRRSPVDPTVYVCAKEAAHGAAGWADHEPLFVMVNMPALSDGVVDDGDDVLAVARARLAAAGAIDDDDEVVWRRSSTGLSHAFPGSLGSLYGPASNSRAAAFTRAKNAVVGVPGLFLASGSAHPGGGVPLCAQSGILAAEAVLNAS